MKPSRPLAVIKSILDSYHQPPPLGNQETRKLYKLLTSSFRKQLDKELGWPTEHPHDSDQTKAAKPSTETSVLTLPKTDRDAIGAEHLRSILSNPLFSYNASKKQRLRLQGQKDPMDTFEEAVSKGLMTPLRAAGCLKAKRRQIMQSSAMNPVEVMASSSAGHRVVQWLRSSGMEKDLAFVGDNQPLIKHLMPFLIAEGMEKTVWVWLDMLSKDHNSRPKPEREAQRTLLFQALVESKYQGATSMNEAYACLAQAKETFPWHKDERPPKYIMSSWQRVTWESTVLAWKHLSKASPELFESFCSIGRDNLERQKLHKKNYKPRHGIEMAHLALHHPTNPNPNEALELLLEDDSIWKNWTKQHEKGSPKTNERERGRMNEKTPETRLSPAAATIRLRSLGLDTVKVCAQQGQTAQAESLLQKMAPYLSRDFHLASENDDFEDDERLPDALLKVTFR